jgi:hypothetical protein
LSDHIVYFMRGIYSCGKSTRAKELAGDTGIVLEVDGYFDTPTEDGIKYLYREYDVYKAQRYVYKELKRSMRLGIKPIIIDRDNNPSAYTKKLMKRVIESGYTPKLAEPTSELWKTLRDMMANKKYVNTKSFVEFAQKLSILSQEKHQVHRDRIFSRIMLWPVNVTIDDFLNFDEAIFNK